MNVIKVNFDNAYVKKPKKLTPNIVAYRYNELNNGVVVKVLRLVIIPKLNEEPLYEHFEFDLFLNDVLVARINENSFHQGENYIIEYRDRSLFTAEFFITKLEGQYSNSSGYIQEVNEYTKKIYTVNFCNDSLVCSERTYVSDFINGTYIYGFYNEDDGRFYYDRDIQINTLGEQEYIYSDEYNTEVLSSAIVDKIFVDVPTMNQYKWNSNTDTFVLQ